MTKMQRDAGHCNIVGSFSDERSYAMTITLSDSHDGTDLSDTGPDSSPPLPPKVVHATEHLKDRALGAAVVAVNPVVEELQHPSEMSTEHSIVDSRNSSDSTHSITRVEFTDIGEESYNFTTSTLRKCKHQVLKPYWGLLMFIGWRVFRHDVIMPRSWCLRVLNIVYPMVVILLLLYTYMYEMIACEWKLDVKDAAMIIQPATQVPNLTTTLKSVSPKVLGASKEVNKSQPAPQPCDHIVTTYLIPNLLHFLTYIIGLYYFRIQDNEQMYALTEKVFLQASPLHSSSSQQKLVRKTRLFLSFGSLWVLLTLGLQGLYVWAFDFPRLAIFEVYGKVFHWVAFSIELLGRILFNSVLLAVVINYATQCEMVMFYVKALTLRLQEKSTDIKTAFKDTLLLRQNLSMLNGAISKMTTLALVILAELTILGLSILAINRYDIPKVWVYRSVFPVVWALMLCFPLVQAARLNSVCLRIKKISLEMRVFGYKSSSQLELDSFLQFVHATRLRAKLFHIPIHPSYMLAVSILAAFIFLILVQTSKVVPNNSIV